MPRSPRRAAAVVAALALPGLLVGPTATAVPLRHGLPSRPAHASPNVSRGRQAIGCATLTTRLSTAERIGQLIMVGQDSRRISPAGQRAIRRDHLGSVVLLGNSRAGVKATRRLTDRLHRTAHPRKASIMIATDQEGGWVQRLRGPGFSTIPSAATQAHRSDHALRADATRWSRQLSRAGVDADLAPVADVVPLSMRWSNAPIGRLDRSYSASPRRASDKDRAFMAGLHAGRTAATVKHFPGLGRVRGNTDTARHVVDTVTTRHDKTLLSFRNDIRSGADLVMVSSATYRRIDRHRPAAFSPTVVTGMLREDLHFGGVVISDDLFARVLSGVPVRQRGVRFLLAGGDLALVGDPAKVDAVYAGLEARAHTDAAFRRRIDRSVTRVLSLKARYGLADCRPEHG